MTGRKWKVYTQEIDGVETTFFTVGAMAHRMNRQVSTIVSWIKDGLIPDTPYRTRQGGRLYTLDQIEEIRRQLKFVADKRRRGLRWTVVLQNAAGETKKVEVARIGALAAALKIGSGAVQAAESTWLPRTPWVADQVRLYSAEMTEAVVQGYRMRRQAHWTTEDVRLYIESWWKRLGVHEWKVLEVESKTRSIYAGVPTR